MNLDERLVDRQRLESAKMEASREHAEFVVKAHETLEGLLNLAPAAKPTPFNYRGKPQEIAELEAQIFKAANLAWALRTFPIFDTSCLRMMRKEKGLKVQLQGRWGGDAQLDLELDLWVPVFAMGPLGHGVSSRTMFTPTYDNYCGHVIEKEMVSDNQREIQTKVKNGTTVTLHAQCPAIPGAILKNLDKVSGRFERTEIIWEAKWSAYAEVDDPLIIGTIGATSFLIDQFDATKLERYVMGEFCRKPVAE